MMKIPLRKSNPRGDERTEVFGLTRPMWFTMMKIPLRKSNPRGDERMEETV
jgi:hypothetical protein